MKGFVLVAAAFCGFAGASPAQQSQPRALNMADLCASVESQTLELEPRHPLVMHQYETMLFDAGGVLPQDDEATVARKMRALFAARMPEMLCHPVNFYPQDGNILKLAVARQSMPFIDEVVTLWKVNLNQIDKADNATVLDYIARKRAEAGSNRRLVEVYQQFYDRFRAAGARLRSEVEDAHAR